MSKGNSFLSVILFIILASTMAFIFFIIQQNIEEKNKIPLLPVDYILIKKKERILELYSHHNFIKSYSIALGFNPIGHKEQEGDGKTPEGKYIITYKNPKSKFYLSLKISYPSEKDHQNATKKGLNPGGDIMIHGLGNQFRFLSAIHAKRDWTLGCIAVTNEEIKEIYDIVQVGTEVEIKP